MLDLAGNTMGQGDRSDKRQRLRRIGTRLSYWLVVDARHSRRSALDPHQFQ